MCRSYGAGHDECEVTGFDVFVRQVDEQQGEYRVSFIYHPFIMYSVQV